MADPVSGFHAIGGALMCDGVALDAIARAAGTPVHVYSAAVIRDRFRELDAAFADYPHRCHYAIKANATLAIVRLMRQLGARADANSGGEIEVALRAGFRPDEIVFTGVGKSRDELERAIALGLHAINAESPGEVARIDAMAGAQGTRARVAVRVNPDVDAESHPHISTGHRASKFGMPVDAARAMVRDLVRRPHLQIVGLHAHVGSQITKRDPILKAAEAVTSLARELSAQGIQLEHVDLGGGLGIAYEPNQTILPPADYPAALPAALRPTGPKPTPHTGP